MQKLCTWISQLTVEKKRIAMKIYVYFFWTLFLAIGLIFIIGNQTDIADQKYLNYLSNYAQNYKILQQNYQKYLFYSQFDKLTFYQKKLNQSYKKGVNQFTNMTEIQFQKMYEFSTDLAISKNYIEIAYFQFKFEDWIPDLSKKIKNMYKNDIGHIFAVIGAIEFYLNKIHKKKQINSPKIVLSEQQIMDCCIECLENKNPVAVYEYIIKYGVSEEKFYPYIGRKQICKRNNIIQKRYFISNYSKISKCQTLQEELQNGPIVVGIDSRQWLHYKYGLFSQCQRKVTHYALLVGRGLGFWQIRNSWGPKWGQKGYIRLKFTTSRDTCGICLHASKPYL